MQSHWGRHPLIVVNFSHRPKSTIRWHHYLRVDHRLLNLLRFIILPFAVNQIYFLNLTKSFTVFVSLFLIQYFAILKRDFLLLFLN